MLLDDRDDCTFPGADAWEWVERGYWMINIVGVDSRCHSTVDIEDEEGFWIRTGRSSRHVLGLHETLVSQVYDHDTGLILCTWLTF